MSTLSDLRSLCFKGRTVTHIYYGDPPELAILPLILGSHQTSLVMGEDVMNRAKSKLHGGAQPVISVAFSHEYTHDVPANEFLPYLLTHCVGPETTSEWQCWFMDREALYHVFGGFLRQMKGRRRTLTQEPGGIQCTFDMKKGERLATATFCDAPLPLAAEAVDGDEKIPYLRRGGK